MEKIRWGILGTGWIAGMMAEALSSLDDAEMIAVGSRTQESADKFADQWNIPNRHPSYEALTNDPEVDVIYIATPHPYHYENAKLCLNARKAVLCEKPFTLNEQTTQELVDLAREKQVFMMEAMWTRFLPAVVQARQWIAEGKIGEVRAVRANFFIDLDPKPEGRLLNPELGGGALLDLGVYPVSFASMVLGTPKEIKSFAYLGETGVDEQVVMIFDYEGSKHAILSTCMHLTAPIDAHIIGDKGVIRVHEDFFKTEGVTLTVNGQEPAEAIFPHHKNGYEYEAMEVMACMRAGKLESDIMTLDESIEIMRMMDTMRADWGLKYPHE